MNDPKAWSNGLSPDRRGVLEAGRRLAAPEATKQAVWGALAAKLPEVAAAGAAAKGVSTLSFTKLLVIGLAAGGAATGGIAGYQALKTDMPDPSRIVSPRSAPPTQPSPASAPSRDRQEEVATTPIEALSALPATRSTVAPRPIEHVQPRTTASAPLEELVIPSESATVLESRRFAAARDSLRAGDARTAVRELDALARDFPNGVLGQERDALRIQALAALGEKDRARELGRSFLDRHPDSPHADAVRRVLR